MQDNEDVSSDQRVNHRSVISDEATTTTRRSSDTDMMMIPSVSMGNIQLAINSYSSRCDFDNISSYIEPNGGRNKMFNGSFAIWKKRDLKSSLYRYSCGQVFTVCISSLGDSTLFYVQEYRLLDDLAQIEASIQNYARVLLASSDIRDKLVSYQKHAAKSDLVLFRSGSNSDSYQWRRAILIDRTTTNPEDEIVDIDPRDISKPNAIFYTFRLIDWGRVETVIDRRGDSVDEDNDEPDLFILPMHERLLSIGPFALKCSINECHLRSSEKFANYAHEEWYVQHREQQEQKRGEFESLFKERLSNKLLKIRINKATNVKNDLEAVVEVFYFPEPNLKSPVNCVKQILGELNYTTGESNSTMNDDELLDTTQSSIKSATSQSQLRHHHNEHTFLKVLNLNMLYYIWENKS